MTVEALRIRINKQFVRVFVFCVRILYRLPCTDKWVNISTVHILGFFSAIFKASFFNFFFFEHVVDEFLKTNPRLVLQETPTPRSLEAFCLLRWNFCPLRWNFCALWRNYRTLWWYYDTIPYIMAPHSMDFCNVEVGSL